MNILRTDSHSRHVARAATVLTSIALAFGAAVATAPAASALPSTAQATVMAKTQKQANPNLNTKELKGWYTKGKRVTLTCYAYGQSVKGWGSPGIAGGWDNLWYKTSDGVYVADVDLSTGSNSRVVANKCGTTTSTKVSLSTFYSKNIGKTLANASGDNAGECVSLVSQYLLQVYGLKTGAWGNALDYRSGGTGGKQLKAAGWKWSTDRNFRDGDIVVWDYAAGYVSSDGHIGVWYQGKVLQQNYNGKRYATLIPFFTQGYLGHWRR